MGDLLCGAELLSWGVGGGRTRWCGILSDCFPFLITFPLPLGLEEESLWDQPITAQIRRTRGCLLLLKLWPPSLNTLDLAAGLENRAGGLEGCASLVLRER